MSSRRLRLFHQPSTPETMRENSREGLIWDDNGLGPEPRWTRDPDLRAVVRVCRRQLGIPDPAPPSDYGPRSREDAEHYMDDRLNVTFHRDGTFNKLYRVTTTNSPTTSVSLFTPTYRSNHSIGGRSNTRRFILRVSLPVDPRNKTLGEAATLDLVRQKTDIPVPRVIAFDETRNNEIGYEWLLMDCMPGVPAYYRWRKMSMREKEVLTVRVADFQAQLLRCGGFGHGFRAIGTLGTTGGDPEGSQHGAAVAASATPEPGPVVSNFFFLGQRYHYPISRGPFSCSHDWLRAQLSIIIKEHTTALGQAKNELDKEYAECALRVARNLLRMLHKIFPSVVHPPERTVLWHDDLSLRNVLVNPNGAVTGVIGWYVHFLFFFSSLFCFESSTLTHSGNVLRPCHDGWLRKCPSFSAVLCGTQNRIATVTPTLKRVSSRRARILRTTLTTDSTMKARRSCTGFT